ncbi:hypothetical protein ACIA8C_02240 [Nocardia sp. NPDC051321]
MAQQTIEVGVPNPVPSARRWLDHRRVAAGRTSRGSALPVAPRHAR